jgi:sulfopyruvate decarboxylase TPP-binding subunit
MAIKEDIAAVSSRLDTVFNGVALVKTEISVFRERFEDVALGKKCCSLLRRCGAHTFTIEQSKEAETDCKTARRS